MSVTHHIKVREKGKTRWAFLTARGTINYLRLHAAQFTEENANKVIQDNQADNPDWEFKAVLINKS